MKESVTYQAILEEGRGEGALTEARKVLRMLGENQFGVPDARSAAVLKKLTDPGRLEQLLVRLPSCHSWEELLKDFAPHRPTRRRP